MACAGCERRRQKAKEARERFDNHPLTQMAKRRARRMLEKLKGGKHAEQSAQLQASKAEGAAAPAEGSGQAGEARPAHRQRSVAKDPGAGAGKGRASVPGVRKAGRGKGSAR